MKLLSVGINATALLLALAVGAAPAIAAGSAGGIEYSRLDV